MLIFRDIYFVFTFLLSGVLGLSCCTSFGPSADTQNIDQLGRAVRVATT